MFHGASTPSPSDQDQTSSPLHFTFFCSDKTPDIRIILSFYPFVEAGCHATEGEHSHGHIHIDAGRENLVLASSLKEMVVLALGGFIRDRVFILLVASVHLTRKWSE